MLIQLYIIQNMTEWTILSYYLLIYVLVLKMSLIKSVVEDEMRWIAPKIISSNQLNKSLECQ